MKVALVQTKLIWEDPESNRAYFSKKIKNMAEGVDLIVLPEMFTTGFTMSPGNIDVAEGKKTLKWMQVLAKEKNTALTGSIVFYSNEKYTNRLFFVQPDGNYYTYDKRHTFTLAGEDKVYKAGSERLVVEYKGFRICPMVCYDLRFPVWARNTNNYDVLLYVANWPTPRINAWDALLKARAIENMAYCIGVNRIGEDDAGYRYSGHSAIYDCLGEQLAFSSTEEVLFVTLSREHISTTRNTLKFLEDRDIFSLQ